MLGFFRKYLNGAMLTKPLDAHITDKTAEILAQLGIDNPAVADKTTVMNYLKVLEASQSVLTTNLATADTVVDAILAQLGTDNPSTADQTTVMNFLKQIKEAMPVGGGIKSIRYYSFTDTSATIKDVTITAVDTTKSYILLNMAWRGGSTAYNVMWAFTSATNVRLTKSTGVGTLLPDGVSIAVVEFY